MTSIVLTADAVVAEKARRDLPWGQERQLRQGHDGSLTVSPEEEEPELTRIFL